VDPTTELWREWKEMRVELMGESEEAERLTCDLQRPRIGLWELMS